VEDAETQQKEKELKSFLIKKRQPKTSKIQNPSFSELYLFLLYKSGLFLSVSLYLM